MILIVGALMTFLVKMGASHRKRDINLGVAAPMAFFPFSGWKGSFFGGSNSNGIADNYMTGLLHSALIFYYRNVTPDPRIPAKLRVEPRGSMVSSLLDSAAAGTRRRIRKPQRSHSEATATIQPRLGDACPNDETVEEHHAFDPESDATAFRHPARGGAGAQGTAGFGRYRRRSTRCLGGEHPADNLIVRPGPAPPVHRTMTAGCGAGCTSGHGVCGLSQGSARSLAATHTFMVTGVLADEAVVALGTWLPAVRRGRPFVTLKLATSLDGRVAAADERRKLLMNQGLEVRIKFYGADKPEVSAIQPNTDFDDDVQLKL